jgi:hypothetical protein
LHRLNTYRQLMNPSLGMVYMTLFLS